MARRGPLSSAGELIAPSVESTLATLDLEDGLDDGIVQLVRRYAAEIDRAEDRLKALATLGPKLAAALEALGATPRGRAGARRPPADGGVPARGSKLAAIRGSV